MCVCADMQLVVIYLIFNTVCSWGGDKQKVCAYMLMGINHTILIQLSYQWLSDLHTMKIVNMCACINVRMH